MGSFLNDFLTLLTRFCWSTSQDKLVEIHYSQSLHAEISNAKSVHKTPPKMFILWVFFFNFLTVLFNNSVIVSAKSFSRYTNLSTQGGGGLTSASFFKSVMRAFPCSLNDRNPSLLNVNPLGWRRAWLCICPLAGLCWWEMGWVGRAHQKKHTVPSSDDLQYILNHMTVSLRTLTLLQDD